MNFLAAPVPRCSRFIADPNARSTLLLGICIGILSSVQLRASPYVVNARSGPWTYTASALNSAYQFGVNDHLAPTLVPVTPGQQISLSYASGSINIASTGLWPANSYVDALGVTAFPNPNLSPHGNGDLPSLYMGESATEPKYLGELVGTFASSSGEIVGSPFAIGNGPLQLLVPAGASQLQMGVNDNLFGDNVGAWSIDVAVVPEPGTITLLALGALAQMARVRRKQVTGRQRRAWLEGRRRGS